MSCRCSMGKTGRAFGRFDHFFAAGWKAPVLMTANRYPATDEGSKALLHKPVDAATWYGPYLVREVPLDPWENPYRYESVNDGSYKISSDGPDGEPDTEDDIVEGIERGSEPSAIDHP